MSLYKLQPNVAKILFMCQYGFFDGVEAKNVKGYDFVLNTKTDVLDDLFKFDVRTSKRLATLRRLDKRMICETEFEFYSGEEFMFIDDLIWLLGKYCIDEQIWFFVREVRRIIGLRGPGCFSVFKDFYHEDKRIGEYFYERVDCKKIHTFRGAEWAHYLFGNKNFSKGVPMFPSAFGYVFLRDLIDLGLPIPGIFWTRMFVNLAYYSDDRLYLSLIADCGLRYNPDDLYVIPFRENIRASQMRLGFFSRVSRLTYSCSPEVIALAKRLVQLINYQTAAL